MMKACIFDLDGTLADTLESIARAVNRGLEHFGYEGRPVEEYNYYAGDGLNAAWQRALNRAGGGQGECLEEGIPLVRSYLAQEPLYHVKPYPGIEASLEKIKRLSVSIGVLSNKPHRQFRWWNLSLAQNVLTISRDRQRKFCQSRICQASAVCWKSWMCSQKNVCMWEIPIPI